MQLNEGMFVGSSGWVLKPDRLRGTDASHSSRSKLTCEVVGISALPPPNGRANKSFSTYINAELLHSQQNQKWQSKTVKTQHVPEAGADALFNEKFEWVFEQDELAFVRCVARLFCDCDADLARPKTDRHGKRVWAGRQDCRVLCAYRAFGAGASWASLLKVY